MSAYKLVKNEGVPVRRAAKLFNVPITTQETGLQGELILKTLPKRLCSQKMKRKNLWNILK